MIVVLENYELAVAAHVGSRRQFSAIMKCSKPRFPEQYKGQLHDNHIRSAMAEMAVAKALNLYWGGHVDTYRNLPDVGPYEIRYSLRSDLKIRPDDVGIVISVTGHPPDMKIAGWIDADEGKSMYEACSPAKGPPAHFIPHDVLYPIEELQAMHRRNNPIVSEVKDQSTGDWLKDFEHG
jgi:hypothetical protein